MAVYIEPKTIIRIKKPVGGEVYPTYEMTEGNPDDHQVGEEVGYDDIAPLLCACVGGIEIIIQNYERSKMMMLDILDAGGIGLKKYNRRDFKELLKVATL